MGSKVAALSLVLLVIRKEKRSQGMPVVKGRAHKWNPVPVSKGLVAWT